MAYFLILESNTSTRRAIVRMIEREKFLPNTVYVTGYPDEGLGLAAKIPSQTDLIVITSDQVYGRTAEQVAMAVKRIRVTAKVFVFASEDTRRLLTNGRIPKGEGDTDLLARFIHSIDDEGYDLVRLRTEFPEIKFSTEPSPG